MYLRLVVLCVHVPQIGSIVCTCTYLRLVVLCVHVPQVGGILCTCIPYSLKRTSYAECPMQMDAIILNLKSPVVVLCDVIASSLFSGYYKQIHHMVTIFRSEVIMILAMCFPV